MWFIKRSKSKGKRNIKKKRFQFNFFFSLHFFIGSSNSMQSIPHLSFPFLIIQHFPLCSFAVLCRIEKSFCVWKEMIWFNEKYTVFFHFFPFFLFYLHFPAFITLHSSQSFLNGCRIVLLINFCDAMKKRNQKWLFY